MTAWTLAGTLAASVAMTGGLAAQMAAGHDPALGPKAQAAADRRHAQRQVIVKRKIVIRKIRRALPPATVPVPAAPASPAPPVAAPAPPPPPPAPVTTRSS